MLKSILVYQHNYHIIVLYFTFKITLMLDNLVNNKKKGNINGCPTPKLKSDPTHSIEIAARLKKGQVPLVYYHKSCRSVFTMKRVLDTIEKKKKVKSNQMENIDATVWMLLYLELRVFPNRSPTTSQIYNKLCIIL